MGAGGFNNVLCEYVAGLIQAGSFLPPVVVSSHSCCALLFHSCAVCGVYCVLGGSGSLGGQFWGTSANLVRGLVYRLGSARLLLLGSTIVLGGGVASVHLHCI